MRELIPVAGAETEGLRLRVIGPAADRPHGHPGDPGDRPRTGSIAIDGIVRKATEVRPQIKDAVFACLACGTQIHEIQEDGAWSSGSRSSAPRRRAGAASPRAAPGSGSCRSARPTSTRQRIEIQENPETLKGGAHPQGLPVLLTEDLTGRVIPGNRVDRERGAQEPAAGDRRPQGGVVRSTTFDLMVLGNSLEYKQQEYDEIEITEEEERLILSFKGDPTIVDKVVLSLAPTIKGMEEEKEAIALQLFGGVEKKHPDGIRVRGDIHVLLVGDPGTAKSQLLRYIADVAPRGIYTSGKGATAAGLTAAAVKDDFAGGRWVLEAGCSSSPTAGSPSSTSSTR